MKQKNFSPFSKRAANSPAFWKFYRDFNWSNIFFSLISAAYFGPVSGLIIFCSFGTLISIVGFQYFKGHEYYIYFNLGFSKKELILMAWICNLLFSLPLILIALLLS